MRTSSRVSTGRWRKLGRSLLVLSCSMVLANALHAAQWARTYGGPSTDVANSVQPTADGGYVVAGYTSSFGAGGTDAWVLKLDANGAIPGCAVAGTSNATVTDGTPPPTQHGGG